MDGLEPKRGKRLTVGGLGVVRDTGGFSWIAGRYSGWEAVIALTGLSPSLLGEGRMAKAIGSDSPMNQSESLVVESVGRVCWTFLVSRGG